MMDLTHGLKNETHILHHIVFGDFDSKDYGLYLAARSAPTPQERTVTVTVPYRQGVIDLSHLRGERIYDNREIRYSFYRFGVSRNAEAGMVQTTLENLLMGEQDQTLYDSYEPFFHYKGKCTGVSVEDDFAYGRLLVEITFQLWPLKTANAPESWDLFDSFNFNLDVMQPSVWNQNIPAGGVIEMINPSKNAGSMIVNVRGNRTVIVSEDNRFTSADPTYELKAGENNRVRLLPGKNFTWWSSPAGYVTIDFYKERI